ncbi:LytTR family DNA-binding domain-containing protein [Bacteroides faecichinchillae]|uniref:LytTR family DNA-binding domain-containing protein n=1 Tax=Bacteroides faecichinchillae TaxID=871325 RepID=UPI0035159BBC
MKVHPIIDYPYRWIPILALGLILVIIQVVMMSGYAGVDYVPAVIDGIATIGWLMALGYLAWFVVGFVSVLQTEVIVLVTGILIWLAGSFMVCDVMERIIGITYTSFAPTIPFRLLFGIPIWMVILLWYRLIVANEKVQNQEMTKETIVSRLEEGLEPPKVELIDRITVKDGSRIHLITTDELIYIQACGDYVMLVTPSGEYVKEQTMKYFETHLPQEIFVRIHRSTIVNVTQISRVELFGKETYQLLLKNGVKLRVSLSGYRLLKERLGL